MSRYLTEYFIEQTLKRGKGVGQFLGGFEHEGQKAIRYLIIYQREEGFQLWIEEAFDMGNENFCDVVSFMTIHNDYDEPIRFVFDTLEETLEFAASNYQADRVRFVSESMLGDEYRDSIFGIKPRKNNRGNSQ